MFNKKLNSIQSKINPEALSSTGYNKNWAMELRYGRQKYSGIELIYYRVEQRVRKIRFMHKIITHPNHQILILSIINYYQLSARITTPILENPTNSIEYISSIWLQDLINFLAQFKIKIITPKFLILQIRRE